MDCFFIQFCTLDTGTQNFFIMKWIPTTLVALLIVAMPGCSLVKTKKLLQKGSVRQTAFKAEVPFEMRYGLIVLKVTIHGRDYDFILDSGAPNVITKELAKELGLSTLGSRKAGDSQGKTSSVDFAEIDSVSIGGIQFLNMGTAVPDLNATPEIACFKADGLIGANLMRLAVWQIDYERQIITITNNRTGLDIPADARHIKFKTALTGTPLADLQMNGQTDRQVIIDLGYNGDFSSSEATFRQLKKNGLSAAIYSYGYGSSGLYGRGQQDTTWYVVVPSLAMGDLTLSNQVVSFNKKQAKTVGTNFFKNYRLILDWSQNEMIMIPVKTYNTINERLYNFSLVFNGNKVLIGGIYGTIADGPKLGDEVLEFGGQDCRNCTPETWCTLLGQRFEKSPPSSTSLLVKRDGRELRFQVSKEALFLRK